MATALQVESLWNGLTDNSGQPLASGKVFSYYAGTTTPAPLYTASDKSTSATNPLILDGNGKAQVWGDGRYKFVVKSSADVTLYTLDNLLYGFDDSTILWGGQSTGSANAHSVSVPAVVGSYANGQRISFIAGYTNTGAVTLAFNTLAPVAIVKGPSATSLQAGDIIAGQLVDCVYESYSGTGRFRLESYPTLSDVQRSRFSIVSNVAGSNTITGDLAPAITSYESGLRIRLKAANTSTNAVTLNLNGLGAKAIQFNGAALVNGEIVANNWFDLVYDGTQFQLLNPAMSASTRTLAATVGQVQDSAALNGGTSAGAANAQTITLSPALTAYATGQRFRFKAGFSNTAATTLAINALAAKAVQLNGAALVSGEIAAGNWHEVIYDGTQFQLMNPALSASTRALPVSVAQLQDGSPLWGGTSTGSANAQAIALSPAITSYVVGQRFVFKAGFANTGSATLAVNSISPAVTIKRFGVPLVGGEIAANDIVEVVYDGVDMELLGVTPDPLFVDRTNSRIGVGTTAPAESIHIKSSTPRIRFEDTDGANTSIFANISANQAATGGINIQADPLNVGTGSFIAFDVDGSQRLLVDSTGNIGIGASSPSDLLHLKSSSPRIRLEDTDGANTNIFAAISANTAATGSLVLQSDGNNAGAGTYMSFQVDGNPKMHIDESGRVQIGASAGSGLAMLDVFTNSNTIDCAKFKTNYAADKSYPPLLFVKTDSDSSTAQRYIEFRHNNNGSSNGYITGNGANIAAFTSSSDIRLKENVTDLPSQWSAFKALRPVEFDFKDGSGHQIGFIAQDVQGIYPDVVGVDPDGFLTLSGMSKHDSRVARVIKELISRVELLEGKVAALEG